MENKKSKKAVLTYILGLLVLAATSIASSSSRDSLKGSDYEDLWKSYEDGYRIGSAIREALSEVQVDSIANDTTITLIMPDYAMN